MTTVAVRVGVRLATLVSVADTVEVAVGVELGVIVTVEVEACVGVGDGVDVDGSSGSDHCAT